MRSAAALIAFAAASAMAQVTDPETTYDSPLDMTIDPNAVTPAERSSWCQGQINTCFLLCDNDIESNTCTQADLKYECTCSDGKTPALEDYTQTMPTYICKALFSQCIQLTIGDQRGQDACTKNIDDQCATEKPPAADDSEDSEDEETSATTSAEQPSRTDSEEEAEPTDDADSAATMAAPAAFVIAAAGLLAILA